MNLELGHGQSKYQTKATGLILKPLLFKLQTLLTRANKW